MITDERGRQPVQGVPTGEILAFERTHRLVGAEFVDAGATGADGPEGECEFQDVNFPVAAEFEHSSQCDEVAEHRVTVPTPLQVLGFWPRVRV